MEPFIFIVLGINVAIVGGALAWRHWFSERGRNRRALKKVRRVPIGQVMEGAVVRVTGIASPADQELQQGPLSERPCLVLEVVVEQKVQQGKTSTWKTLIREVDFVSSFWVEDDTGKVLVQLEYPQLVLTQDARFTSGILKEPDQRLLLYLHCHGESHEGMVFNKNLRYREGVIEPGEEVTVLGVARREPDPDPTAAAEGYRGRAMRLVLRAPQEAEMVISDIPGLTRKR